MSKNGGWSTDRGVNLTILMFFVLNILDLEDPLNYTMVDYYDFVERLQGPLVKDTKLREIVR